MYKCQTCSNNNNGWCNVKKFNGLKKRNIQLCEYFKINGDELIIEKSKDGFGVNHLTISINGNEVFIPQSVMVDFINSDSKNIKIEIPDID